MAHRLLMDSATVSGLLKSLVFIMNVTKKNSVSHVIFLSLFSVSLAGAKALDDQLIELEAGQWDIIQNTYINGREVPEGRTQHSECLPEAESVLTIEDYTKKLMSTMNSGTTCDISNIKESTGTVTFDVQCTALHSPVTTHLSMRYDYTKAYVEVKGEGKAAGGGHSMQVKIESTNKRVGPCLSE